MIFTGRVGGRWRSRPMRAICFTSAMRGVVALTEEGVSAIQTGIGDFGDEELGSVGAGASVGIGQASGAVEIQIW